jgi:hypothetical protein
MTQLHRLFKQLSLKSPIITTLSLLFLLLMNTIPIKDRSYFESALRNKTILQAAFFGFERGSPYLYVRSYRCQTRSSGEIMIEVERQECVARCDMLAILGKSRAVEKYISQTADYQKRPPIELARKFVELEIADEPEIVGPPIDILQITKTGAIWKQRKPECQPNSSLLNSLIQ